MPRKKRHRYVRAVFGSKDRRFPKRDPEIEAMYPGPLRPSCDRRVIARPHRCESLSIDVAKPNSDYEYAAMSALGANRTRWLLFFSIAADAIMKRPTLVIHVIAVIESWGGGGEGFRDSSPCAQRQHGT